MGLIKSKFYPFEKTLIFLFTTACSLNAESLWFHAVQKSEYQ